jgi:hypothetical protein
MMPPSGAWSSERAATGSGDASAVAMSTPPVMQLHETAVAGHLHLLAVQPRPGLVLRRSET